MKGHAQRSLFPTIPIESSRECALLNPRQHFHSKHFLDKVFFVDLSTDRVIFVATVILIVFIAVMLFWGKRRFDQKKQLAAEALTQGQAFLEKNQNEEGVMTTESGLQYKVLEKGEGSEQPSATSKVKVHYHGTLINGQVFDSSVDRGQPISFGLNQVIPGWTEGLQMMSVGDKFRLFIPANLAYGSGGAGKIPGNSALIFDVELLGIE